jgi:integral membrane protein (TIGR01906 family)
MKKYFQAAGCISFSLVLLLGLLCGSILSVAGNANYMNALFLRHANPIITGVDVQEYPGLADKITAYLLGKADSFQTTLSVHGQMREAFSERDLTHMQDVRNLFTLSRTLLLVCVFITAVCLALLIRFFPMRTLMAKCLLYTSLFIAVLGAALAIWAAKDFLSLFTLFHRLFFTNDLWQLPREDLLIQLMPTGFFVEYAARIGLYWLSGTLIFDLAATQYLKRRKRLS